MNGESMPAHQDLTAQNERLTFALNAAQVGTWDLDIKNQQVWWDDCCKTLYGFHQDDIVPYQQVLSYMHPEDRPRVDEAVQWALNPQSDGHYDVHFRTIGAEDKQLRRLHCRGRAYFDEHGQPYRFSGTAQDETQLLQTRRQLQTSEAQFEDLVTATPVATAVFIGRDMLIRQVNTPMLAIWGKDTSVIGKTLHVAMPELEEQPFLAQLQYVFDTGEPFRQAESVADMIEHEQPKRVWFNHAYNPLYDQEGQIYGVINVAIDVTAQVLARQKIEESELFARTLFDHSPIAKAVFIGQDMVIQTANQNMLSMWGKGSSVIGKPLMEAMPELIPTPQLARLQRVLSTGETFYQAEEKFELLRYGALYTGFYEYTYEALRSATGAIYGVICAANEVTHQVVARQKVEASEAHLQLLRDTVPAMIFYLDDQQRYQSYNRVFKEWYSVGDEAIGKTVREFIGEQDYQNTWPHLAKAYLGQQVQYDIHSPSRMNADRWLTIVYTPHANQAGQVIGVIVHATDISFNKQVEIDLRESEERYRQLSTELEQQVQARTQELQLANQDLRRSNDNLQQFAYVASHDLQEPLRKIQSFSTLLEQQFEGQLTEIGKNYLHRITNAGARMSTLIRDLLTYSRISTRQQSFGMVSLEAIVANVLTTLDWSIQEREAQIEIDELPVVKGDESQLNQLFQNLLSNAIKFTPAGQKPQIHVRCFQQSRNELPPEVRPTSDASLFYQISVSDQGVGFDSKYLDRIFQVFQRLHGKNEFPGTGVGLAICERVVENHGGAITANSKLGEGATFYIYLPS